MYRLPVSLRTLLLVALASSTVTALPASSIFASSSEATCGVKGFEPCGGDLPDSFCCSDGYTCLSLAGATTVLCCPDGVDCGKMDPIPCNIQMQNPEKSPESPLKTIVFDVDLESCGSSLCCPFGYSCADSGDGKICQQNKDQSEKPKASTTTVSKATSTATDEPTDIPSSIPTDIIISSSATTTEEPTATATGDESNEDGQESKKSGPDTNAILGGVLGAIGILLIIAVALFICVRKRAQALGKQTQGPKRPEMLHGRNISEPVAQPNIYRSEFMLRGQNESIDGGVSRRDTQLTDEGAPRESRLRRLTLRSHKDRLSIPNHFANGSPNPSFVESDRSSNASWDDVRTGSVSAKLAPIRAMKASSRYMKTKSRHLRPERAASRNRRSTYGQDEGSSEQINVFADSLAIPGQSGAGGYARETRFTDLMKEADLAEVQSGKPYVPTGATPRI